MTTGAMRIQRALARAGVASRRRAEQMIAAGRVMVNGTPAAIGQVVDPEHDAIAVDGTPIGRVVADYWLVLNKPAGVITSRGDPRGRRTVFDLVPQVPGLTYVGRLDYLTEGVLLLTTNGDAAHALMHPSREVERTYAATVRGDVPAALRAMRRGVDLEDGPVRPRAVQAEPVGQGRWDMSFTIAEGRNREVRRLCRALDLFVDRLVRIRFGPVSLGQLAPGGTRPLSERERAVITAVTTAQR
ncbi:MAG TPA: pseudouridine synthase [Gemmatimonadaceae bacterium]|nr:pseudouridine synthase [Gemmatimonadaceae bacterium]